MRKTIEKECITCNKTFIAALSEHTRGHANYCSIACGKKGKTIRSLFKQVQVDASYFQELSKLVKNVSTEDIGEVKQTILELPKEFKTFINNKLYFGSAPPPGLTRVTWINVPEGSSTETIFDQGSLQFVAPVDMYDPTTTYDKYLVYPKANILE